MPAKSAEFFPLQVPAYTFDDARLSALDSYSILDTPSEAGFDDVVQLATQICQAPVALVSLVARDRQWFKAKIGFGPSETDLASSVCAHALVQPDLLVIPDLTLDERTKANPLVVGEPNIRFYAGAPLRTASGEVVGSLCVIDGVPRPQGLSPVQADGLRNLARQVITHLELRRALAERDALEMQQRILNQELSHRMKNTLAMVQALATQTLRKIADREPIDAFTKRIHALSTAHDVLLQQNWAAAGMREVVNAVLGVLEKIERFDVSGPPVTLSSRTTLSLSLLLHELSTNALKYGALSNEGGRIRVSWQVKANEGREQLILSWLESGGPPVIASTHRGFGSKLIGMGLMGTGGVDLRYNDDGLTVTFTAPLDEVQLG